MTIERIHSEDGFPLDISTSSESPDTKLWNIIIDNFHQAQILPEGEYDLTPAWWTKHLHRHTLVVLSDGTGIYRGIPRDSDVGVKEVTSKGVSGFRPGGIVAHIPLDQEIAVVAGPLKDRRTMGIYEIIFHIPGPSPK